MIASPPTIETRCRDRVLVDTVQFTPTDLAERRTRRAAMGVIAALVLAPCLALWCRFALDLPSTYDDSETHFKYGSIGSEPGGSVLSPVGGMLPPYEIFRVLPSVCPDRLPKGYASLGLLFEPGHDLPIGVSKRYRLGFEQVGVNCALCHTGTYRDEVGGIRHVVPGMPANQVDLQGLFRFVTGCVLDPRFTAENVISHVERSGGSVSWVDAFLYRTRLVGTLRESALAQQNRVGALLDAHAFAWGPGRVDTFNPYKAAQFHWKLDDLPERERAAAADYPSLWNQKPRQGLSLHWDGNNDSVDERNLSAALGAGVTPVTVDHASIKRIRDWIWTLPPPRYPYAVDASLAERGGRSFAQHCATCHGDHRFREGIVPSDAAVGSASAPAGSLVAVGPHLGAVTLLGDVGTDAARIDAYTIEFAANQNTLFPESPHRFVHFRKTPGYANQPLDGIWLRAPYLHNGSVPTLRDLLDPPPDRPHVFYRGDDLYDRVKVGFVSDRQAEEDVAYSKYDTSLDGNRNSGHLYGTSLSSDEKTALVEYMKTF